MEAGANLAKEKGGDLDINKSEEAAKHGRRIRNGLVTQTLDSISMTKPQPSLHGGHTTFT